MISRRVQTLRRGEGVVALRRGGRGGNGRPHQRAHRLGRVAHERLRAHDRSRCEDDRGHGDTRALRQARGCFSDARLGIAARNQHHPRGVHAGSDHQLRALHPRPMVHLDRDHRLPERRLD